ncbi:MAG TPA: nuclease-related domain-containing protein [Polyangiaceae bacterium]
MALPQHRIVLHGDTPYAHEREAIAFVEAELPNTNPFLVWELVDLLEGSTGRLYEIDLLVLGYSALYLVEIKSGPGTYKGDCVDWYRDVAGEPPHYLECPYRLTNTKAKVLGSLLQRKLGSRAPWVQPLVFLSHPETKLSLRPTGSTVSSRRRTERSRRRSSRRSSRVASSRPARSFPLEPLARRQRTTRRTRTGGSPTAWSSKLFG